MLLSIGRLLSRAPSTPVVLSGAGTLLAAESNGLALDFTDSTWFASQGFYGSARIKDVSTPANEYDSSPTKTASSLLTYTSPSPKLTLGPSGTYRYQAHNLYLNSASPANQAITVVSGATYAVTITGSVSVTASGAATGTWTAGTQTFTAATTTLTFGSTSGSGTVHVRRTPSDSTYLATTAAARYGLPYEWNTSAVLQGILVEEARTNSVTYSSKFDNAAWTKQNSTTVSADATTAPDGTTTADKFQESASTGTHQLYNAPSASGSMTATVYAKAAERSWIAINCYDGGDNRTYFNVSTGAVGTNGSGNTASIESVGNGWYRCRVTRSVAGGWLFAISVTTGDGVSSHAGSAGSGVYLWGAQAELGSTASSPIETFGSTVTRAADNISLATSAFPLSATAGTLYIQYANTIGQANGTAAILCEEADAGANRIGHYIYDGTDNTLIVTDAGALQCFSSTGGSVGDTPKWAGAWSANDFAAVRNGGTPSTDSSGTITTTIDTLRLGRQSTVYLGGHIKQIRYLPRRMSNAELQAVTA